MLTRVNKENRVTATIATELCAKTGVTRSPNHFSEGLRVYSILLGHNIADRLVSLCLRTPVERKLTPTLLFPVTVTVFDSRESVDDLFLEGAMFKLIPDSYMYPHYFEADTCS